MNKSYVETLMDFIQKSPSPFHVVANLARRLDKEGFCALSEASGWELRRGEKYYTTRNGSALIAFAIPENSLSGYRIMASHSDSPAFKIKPNPEMEMKGCYVRLNVEGYGGMLRAPWFDRPLSVAGRLVVRGREQDRPEILPVNVDRDLLMIPSLAIHMDREANKGAAYNIQQGMLPIFGDEAAAGRFLRMVCDEVGVPEEELLDYDLWLYDRSRPSVWGACGEFFSSPRLDDLECAFGTFEGFVESTGMPGYEKRRVFPVYALFDNEEVGSGSKQGAAGTFLPDVLHRIHAGLGRTEDDFYVSIANSFLISADNAHAVHPNHTDKADPVNRPGMNGGIVIKYSANQKYTTDAVSGARCKLIAEAAGVPYQVFTNHSDSPGGSTLGNLVNLQVSMDTADIGLAQLAMHSCYETAGTKDLEYLIRFSKVFYQNG